ncbi:hypothetical protein BC332_23229 [Capsicum chinense]|nr:hypothetical protein BC332_23229 [Capsicum chinense]
MESTVLYFEKGILGLHGSAIAPCRWKLTAGNWADGVTWRNRGPLLDLDNWELEALREVGYFNDMKVMSNQKKRSLQKSRSQRQLEEPNADSLPVTDLIHLEKELQTTLMQIRSRKVPQRTDGPVENASTGNGFNFDQGNQGIPGNPNWQGDRFQRVKFSKFYGDDIKGWVYKAEQYFEYMTTPEGKKVQTTTIYMEGKALQWHQAYMKARLGVRMLGPQTLMKAYNQAKLVEQLLKLHHGHTQAPVKSSKAILPNPNNPWSNQSRVVNLKNPKVGTNPTITGLGRLSPAEMDEKRSQGICYWCDEKYMPTHKCNRRKQLFILGVTKKNEEAVWEDATEGKNKMKRIYHLRLKFLYMP